MNELIPITYNDDGTQAVSGRALHEFLEIGTKYQDWFPRMVEYGLIEGHDFVEVIEEVHAQKRERTYQQKDHALTINAAKQISMLQRNEKGRQAREYFIRCEEKYNKLRDAQHPRFETNEQLLAQAALVAQSILQEQTKEIKQLETKVDELEPKAERYEDLTNCEGLFTATELAKDYGMTAIAFNKLLHQQGIQYKAGNIWVPYRAYQNEGFLRTVNYKPDNSDRTVQQSRWTMKGKEFVYELFRSLDIHPLYKSNEQLTIN